MEPSRKRQKVSSATRAPKDKGKRGRKRKSGTLEAQEDTAGKDTAETARRGRKRTRYRCHVATI